MMGPAVIGSLGPICCDRRPARGESRSSMSVTGSSATPASMGE